MKRERNDEEHTSDSVDNARNTNINELDTKNNKRKNERRERNDLVKEGKTDTQNRERRESK